MKQPKTLIGRAERVALPILGASNVPARIDTGAKTSALWASNIKESGGVLSYTLFGEGSELYTGVAIKTAHFTTRVVSSSTGHTEERYAVQNTVILAGRKIRATFTLANRKGQVYPVLVGRNILRGKFLVDVKLGEPLRDQEKLKEKRKQTISRQTMTSEEKL